MTIRGEIPVDLLREAFTRSGLTQAEVARRAGWHEQAVARALGLRVQYVNRNGKRYGPYQRKAVTYETAVELAHAIGVDPHEVRV